MMTINVYLTFDGNCEEAFNFYQSVFGGDFQSLSRFAEMPPQEGMPPIPDAEKDNIMHMSLPIGSGTVLMGSDTAAGFGPPLVTGNNFSISIDTDTREDADRVFRELSAGGSVTMPMSDTFWGSYFGMVTDKFKIQWMVSVEQTPD